MGLRGETIGTAFVRILAEGSGLPQSIKDEFEKNRPVMEAQGQKDSDAYTRAWQKEFKKSGTGKIDKTLTEGIARSNAIEEAFSGPRWQKIMRRLEKQFGDVGLVIGNEIQAGVRDAGDLDVVRQRLANISGEVRKAEKIIEVARASEQAASDKAVRNAARLKQAYGVELNKAYRDLTISVEKYIKGEHQAGVTRKSLLDDINRLEPKMHAFGSRTEKIGNDFDFMERKIRSSIPRIDGWAHSLDLAGNKVTKVFGGGARNNFVNFVGKFSGGIVEVVARVLRLPSVFKRVFSVVSDAVGAFTKTFLTNFQQAEGGLVGFGFGLASVAPQVGAALLQLAAAAGVLAVALALVFTALGTLTTLALAAVGAVGALAASISFGLVGALAPLLGLIAPLVIGLGVLVIGIKALTNVNKANKKELTAATTAVNAAKRAVAAATPGTKAHTTAVEKLNRALAYQAIAQKKVNDEFGNQISTIKVKFKELQQVAAGGLLKGLRGAVADLVPAIGSLKPIVRDVAAALGTAIQGFVHNLVGPEFQTFLISMRTFVPGAIVSLGKIFTNTFNAINGLFVALEPYTKRFLDFSVNASGALSDLTNTAAGKNKLKTFFDAAATSASKLWDLVTATSGLIGALLGTLKTPGDNIITDLAGQFRDWTTALNDPKNQSGIADFKQNLQDVATGLGNIVIAVAKLVGELNTPENKKSGSAFLKAVAVGFDAIGLAAQGAAPHLAVEGFIFGKVRDFAVELWKELRTIGTWTKNLFLDVQHFFAGIGGLWSKAGSAIASAASYIWGKVNGLHIRLGGLVGVFLGAGRSIIQGFIDGFKGKGFISSIAGHLWDFLRGEINRAIHQINRGVEINAGPIHINPPDIPDVAMGGIFSGRHTINVGEAGREAVIPLDRPLALVDPAVRALSAIAQGLALPQQKQGRSVDASGWTIVTPTADPRGVAAEVLNRLTAAAYA